MAVPTNSHIAETERRNAMKDYKQICVWPGTLLTEEGKPITDTDIKKFEEFFKKEFDVTIHYLETVTTLPDKDENGNPVKDTGGRKDVFFTIEDEDIPKFAVRRLGVGIQWYEDYLDSKSYDIIPPEIVEKYPRGW